jgi:hypothetical protein
LQGLRALPSLILRGGGGLAGGAVLAAAALPVSAHRAVRWSCVCAAGAGKLVGLTPIRYSFY